MSQSHKLIDTADSKKRKSVAIADLHKVHRPKDDVKPASWTGPPEVSVRSAEPTTSIPFPEWIDNELKKEKWIETTDKKINRIEIVSEESIVIPEAPSMHSLKPETEYKDPDQIELPPSLKKLCVGWKRPKDIFKKKDLVLYSRTAPICSDFLSLNKHIVHSELIRQIITGINILQYVDFYDHFADEMVTSCYVPTATGPWKGWHHVYAFCHIGKIPHRPLINRYGKYIVRLYYMGLWRKFTVDDLLPVDACDLPLLPRVQIPDSSTIELWPMIVAKALIKVASLSYKKSSEVNDFNAIYLFTGWSVVEHNPEDFSENALWELLLKYTDRYDYPPKPEKVTKRKSVIGSIGSVKKIKIDSKYENDMKMKGPLEDLTPKYMCALLKDLTQEQDDLLPGISPCFSHSVLIRQTRNTPLEYVEPVKEPAAWKYFRWIPWAIKNNIWEPDEPINIRALKVVSFMKKCFQQELNDPQPQHEPVTEPVIPIIEPEAQEKEESTTKLIPLLPGDLGIWVDLENILKYIKKIYIFIKPSTQMYNYKLSAKLPYSSRNKITASEGQGDGKKKRDHKAKYFDIAWPNTLSCFRNNPIYLFMENLEDSYIYITFSHFNLNAVKDHNVDSEEQSFGYCLLEEFNWRSYQGEDPCFIIKTTGSKTDIVWIPKGRKVFKLWFKSETTYSLHIMSKTQINLGSLEQILQLISCDSYCLRMLAYRISSAYYELLISFGIKEYKHAIKNFYGVLKCDHEVHDNNQVNFNLPSYIYEAYFNSLLEIIKTVSSNEEEFKEYKRALRILFIDPNIGRALSIVDERVDQAKGIKEKAADTIKSFFRLVYVKKIMMYHDPKHLNYKLTWNSLKSIYDKVFADTHRNQMAFKLFHNFFDDRICKKVYSLSNESKFTLKSFFYQGSVQKVGANKWTPIMRMVLFSHSKYPVVYRLELFCGLTLYMLRVFDNDNNKEVPLFNNTPDIFEYENNSMGYTVVGYGWNTTSKPIPVLKWKFGIFCETNEPLMHCCDNMSPKCNLLKVPKLMKQTVMNYYIPDQSDLICKCLVKVQDNAQLMIAWQSSDKDAVICLSCISDQGTTIGQLIHKGSFEMPVLLLEYRRDSDESMVQLKAALSKKQLLLSDDEQDTSTQDFRPKHLLKPKLNPKFILKDTKDNNKDLSHKSGDSTIKEKIYIVEAIVIDKKWPLPNDEWVFSDKVKESRYFKNALNKERSLNPTLKKNGLKEFGTPNWSLSIGFDSDHAVTVAEDRSREEEILEMKRSWEEKSPGRALRSEEIRKHYLECKRRNYHYCLPSEDMLSEESEKGMKLKDNSFTDVILGHRPASPSTECRMDLSTANKFNKEDYKKSLIHPKLQLVLEKIPGLDLSKYPESRTRCYLTPTDAESLTFSRIVYLKDFWKLQDDWDKESAELRHTRQRNTQKILDHLERVMSEGEHKTMEVYAKRAACLASLEKGRSDKKRAKKTRNSKKESSRKTLTTV